MNSLSQSRQNVGEYGEYVVNDNAQWQQWQMEFREYGTYTQLSVCSNRSQRQGMFMSYECASLGLTWPFFVIGNVGIY